jgi:hypothetical protein
MNNHDLLQRAFEIADTGEVSSMVELRRKLASEGFAQWQTDQLGDKGLRKQLTDKIRTSNSSK